MQRASHALAVDGRVYLVDPVDFPELDARVRALGEPAAVLQLLDRHGRDCAAVAARLGVPRLETPAEAPPFELLPVVKRRFRREVALWWPERRVLVVADALGTADYFLAPGDRLGVHPPLRLFPPRRLARLDPEHILCGHGAGVHERAAEALHEALATSRRRTPRLLWKLVRHRSDWR
jgi:hypothetical protein